VRVIPLILIVFLGCGTAIVRPKLGLCFYLMFALMRPDILAFSYGHPYSMVIAICTLIGSLVYLPDILRSLWNPFTLALLALVSLVGMSSAFALHPEYSYPEFYQYARGIIMVLLIPALFRTKEEIFRCILAMAMALGVIGLKFGLFGLVRGGVQFGNGFGGFMADNNTLALAIVMAIPLAWYGATLTKGKLRTAFYISVFFDLVAVVMSHSRGGLLSLAIVLLLIALRSKHRIATIVVTVVFLSVPVVLVRNTLIERVSTIGAYQQDESAVSRLVYAKAALRMWADHPVSGVGFGTFNERLLLPSYLRGTEFEGKQMVVHNTYVQMLVDSGIFAFIVYLTLLFGTILWLQKSVKKARLACPGDEACPLALQISLIGFMVGSAFLSRVDFDFTYMLIMSAGAWYRYQKSAPPISQTPAQPQTMMLATTWSRVPTVRHAR